MFKYDQYTTLAELKSQYKNLCLIYHPDNKNTGSHNKFITLKREYDKLIKTHKPIPRPPPPKPKEEFRGMIFYRLIDKLFNNHFNTTIPKDVLNDYNIKIWFMGGGCGEFNIVLKKGTKLPLTIEVVRFGIKIRISFNKDSGYLYESYKKKGRG